MNSPLFFLCFRIRRIHTVRCSNGTSTSGREDNDGNTAKMHWKLLRLNKHWRCDKIESKQFFFVRLFAAFPLRFYKKNSHQALLKKIAIEVIMSAHELFVDVCARLCVVGLPCFAFILIHIVTDFVHTSLTLREIQFIRLAAVFSSQIVQNSSSLCNRCCYCF